MMFGCLTFKEKMMKRRKVLKIVAGTTAGLTGTAVASYFVLDKVFNPKTPLDYVFPNDLGQSASLAPTLQCLGSSQATLTQTEGPFYTPNTPKRINLREAGIIGTPLTVSGFVVDTQCQPIAGAVLDFWSCDGNGVYDNEGMRLRGHQYTDTNGYYRLETVRPSYYETGPFGSRTAHIHVKVQGENTSLLTTQLYFPNEALNLDDGIFNEMLLLTMDDEKPEKQSARFNFVLDN
jgi:protocatechuate 3,4-dioxygenase beta subunit